VYAFDVPVCAMGQTSGCPTERLTITVLDPAIINRPVANVDLAITMQGVNKTVYPLINDHFGNAIGALNPASVVITSPSSTNYTLVVSSLDGSILFIPDAAFTGDAKVDYTVCDNGTPPLCATSSILFKVLPTSAVNATLAADDQNIIEYGETATGNLKTNDTDPQGDPQSVTPQTTTIAGKGTLTLNAAGDYTFVPVSGFSGTVDFPYQTCDNQAIPACTNATLHILVNPDFCTGPRPPVLLGLGLDKSLYAFCDDNGWIYYRATRGATTSMLAIHPNGNTAFDPQSVKIDALQNVANVAMTQTANGHTTTIADRLFHVIAPGTYTENGGLKVRLYYDATEFASLPTTNRTWFKHIDHTKTAVNADLTATDLSNAIRLTPNDMNTENNTTYAEFHNIQTFSTFGFLGSTSINTLPVKLLSFTGEINGKVNDLKWATATELNNDRFELERSANGTDWKAIGTVGGNGTTNTTKNYTYTDAYPLATQNYYRLRQIDFDGKFELSTIIMLNNRKTNSFVVAPNPITNTALITLSAPAQNSTIELIDVLGRTLYQENIADDTTTFVLSTNDLPSGTYFIRVMTNGKAVVQRVVVNK
jgi:hypothetical protein